jgi:hypothetical protein
LLHVSQSRAHRRKITSHDSIIKVEHGEVQGPVAEFSRHRLQSGCKQQWAKGITLAGPLPPSEGQWSQTTK